MSYKALHISNPHISLIWSSGILHAELYGLPLPTFSLLLIVTSHLVLDVFARQLLLSGIVSTLAKLPQHLHHHSTHLRNIWNPTSFNCLSPACRACDYVYTDYVRRSRSSSCRLVRPINCQTYIALHYITTFRRQLKSHLFHSISATVDRPISAPLIRSQ